ncbi:hypothetical protein A2707_04595 [Candidatus Saccharibacteria bacterium RIFCSPHIGHO2_01_FULL_45_15]|nr:MAG: hypothetical protein A2707_04595 [Candidatus Saccharibacteria bacterium RIFCSPHIGHO2_01_FULL_45_15]OGL27443.1 MAG: hypothetical protein A3C39_05615 [Candidatus Saccharibacteria bacterium RIFCSPHIGHO2_02_FULL_46_12]OGL32746.1 MAG: hypothetical protein A3E76_05365 [Candidatus Saccharibacteria bacterium RIFCSPHIGHO2_12_FULL_44_22]
MNNEPLNTPAEQAEQIEQPIVQPVENTQEHDQPKKQESRKGLLTKKIGAAVAAFGALVSPGHNSQPAPQPEANEVSVTQPTTDLLHTNTVESMPASEPVHGELGNLQQPGNPESIPSVPDYNTNTAESPEFAPPVMPPFPEMPPSLPDQQFVTYPVGSIANQEAIVSTPFPNSEVIKQMVDTAGTNSTNISNSDTITKVE